MSTPVICLRRREKVASSMRAWCWAAGIHHRTVSLWWRMLTTQVQAPWKARPPPVLTRVVWGATPVKVGILLWGFW